MGKGYLYAYDATSFVILYIVLGGICTVLCPDILLTAGMAERGVLGTFV